MGTLSENSKRLPTLQFGHKFHLKLSNFTFVVSSELLPTAWKHIECNKQIETEVFTISVGGLVIH